MMWSTWTDSRGTLDDSEWSSCEKGEGNQTKLKMKMWLCRKKYGVNWVVKKKVQFHCNSAPLFTAWQELKNSLKIPQGVKVKRQRVIDIKSLVSVCSVSWDDFHCELVLIPVCYLQNLGWTEGGSKTPRVGGTNTKMSWILRKTNISLYNATDSAEIINVIFTDFTNIWGGNRLDILHLLHQPCMSTPSCLQNWLIHTQVFQ